MLALQYTHTNTRDHPYLGELPAYIKHKREAGGGEREAQKDGKNCPVLHCEAEQSSKQGQLKPLSPGETWAGCRLTYFTSPRCTQEGWVGAGSPLQSLCQGKTWERMTYRRTVCTRHARKTGFAQRPLKTNRKIISCNSQSPQSTSFACFSRERLQGGGSIGKAAMTCKESARNLGFQHPRKVQQ